MMNGVVAGRRAHPGAHGSEGAHRYEDQHHHHHEKLDALHHVARMLARISACIAPRMLRDVAVLYSRNGLPDYRSVMNRDMQSITRDNVLPKVEHGRRRAMASTLSGTALTGIKATSAGKH